MQELHLVGFTTDRRNLIFSTRQGAKSGSFLVPVDQHLLDVLADLREELGSSSEDHDDLDEIVVPQEPESRVEAKLSVREVQARLRAGDDVEDIAARAGVDPAWVERFAPPIRAEQQQIVERALSTPLERPRAGLSSVPLRDAVSKSMAERDITYTAESFAAAWSARLVGADRWAVEFTFVNRGRDRTILWTFDAATRSLTTSDRFASQLGFVAGEAPVTDAAKPPKRGTGEQPGGGGEAGEESQAAGSAPVENREANLAPNSSRTKASSDRKSTAKTSSAPTKPTAKKSPGSKSTAKSSTTKKVAAAKKAAADRMEKDRVKRVAAAKRAAEKKAVADEKAKRQAERDAEKQRVADERAATEKAEADQRAAEEAARVRQAESEIAAIAEAVQPEPEPRPDPEPQPEAEPESAAQPEPDPEPEPEQAPEDTPQEPPARRIAPRPDQAVVRLRSSQRTRQADVPDLPEEPAARVAARRARAAERSVPTAQFRSGSAVQASSSARFNGLRTGHDGGSSPEPRSEETDPPEKRPRRTRPLRAK